MVGMGDGRSRIQTRRRQVAAPVLPTQAAVVVVALGLSGFLTAKLGRAVQAAQAEAALFACGGTNKAGADMQDTEVSWTPRPRCGGLP